MIDSIFVKIRSTKFLDKSIERQKVTRRSDIIPIHDTRDLKILPHSNVLLKKKKRFNDQCYSNFSFIKQWSVIPRPDIKVQGHA